jgi:hypothetical protein
MKKCEDFPQYNRCGDILFVEPRLLCCENISKKPSMTARSRYCSVVAFVLLTAKPFSGILALHE